MERNEMMETVKRQSYWRWFDNTQIALAVLNGFSPLSQYVVRDATKASKGKDKSTAPLISKREHQECFDKTALLGGSLSLELELRIRGKFGSNFFQKDNDRF